MIKTNNQKCKINMLSTIGPLIKGNDKTKNTLRYSAMMNNIWKFIDNESIRG